MDEIPPETAVGRSPNQFSLSPIATLLLATSFGLCGGYLDLGFMLFKKYFWNPDGYIGSARDFPWSVPAGHAVLLVIPGLAVAATNGVRPGFVSLRVGAWLFATLSIWGGLLRMPLITAQCSLTLWPRRAGSADQRRGGCGPLVEPAARCGTPSTAVVGLLGVLATFSSGRQAVQVNTRGDQRLAASASRGPSPATSC